MDTYRKWTNFDRCPSDGKVSARVARVPRARGNSMGGSVADPKIACRGVWKLFGRAPERFLDAHGGNPPAGAFAPAGIVPAVRDATLDVFPGEIVVIMGLSGSGKSTLVRCLSRLVEPTAGEILFDGRDLLAASPREMVELRRHEMGMVFQHFALLPHRTVLRNVALPLEVQGIEKSARYARAMEVIELVGLKGREDYYPRELSGGQQQRVGIARSLAVEPDVWFLDEPFSALDPLIRREMQDEFLRLQSLLHKTIVFITHDFDEALRLADRVAIMYEGLIVQVGTPEELITNPATDYVAEFTRHVPREKLLTVGSVMRRGADAPVTSPTVRESEKIAAAARRVLAADGAVRVLDEEGATVGTVARSDVVDALFDSEPASS